MFVNEAKECVRNSILSTLFCRRQTVKGVFDRFRFNSHYVFHLVLKIFLPFRYVTNAFFIWNDTYRNGLLTYYSRLPNDKWQIKWL